jgi:hypothetical protein
MSYEYETEAVTMDNIEAVLLSALNDWRSKVEAMEKVHSQLQEERQVASMQCERLESALRAYRGEDRINTMRAATPVDLARVGPAPATGATRGYGGLV